MFQSNILMFHDPEYLLLADRSFLDACKVSLGGLTYEHLTIKELVDMLQQLKEIPKDWTEEYIAEQLPYKNTISSKMLAKHIFEAWLIKDETLDDCQNPFDILQHNPDLNTASLNNDIFYNFNLTNVDKTIQQQKLANILFKNKPQVFYYANQSLILSNDAKFELHKDVTNTEIGKKISQHLKQSVTYLKNNPFYKDKTEDSLTVEFQQLNKITNPQELEKAYVGLHSFYMIKKMFHLINDETYLNTLMLEHIAGPCLDSKFKNYTYQPMVDLFIVSVFNKQILKYSKDFSVNHLGFNVSHKKQTFSTNPVIQKYFNLAFQHLQNVPNILHFFRKVKHLPHLFEGRQREEFFPFENNLPLPLKQEHLDIDPSLLATYFEFFNFPHKVRKFEINNYHDKFEETNINHARLDFVDSLDQQVAQSLLKDPSKKEQIKEFSLRMKNGTHTYEVSQAILYILESNNHENLYKILDIFFEDGNALTIMKIITFSHINCKELVLKILKHPLITQEIQTNPDFIKNLFDNPPTWTHQNIMNSNFMQAVAEIRFQPTNFSYQNVVSELFHTTTTMPSSNLSKLCRIILINYSKDILNDDLADTHKQLFQMASQQNLFSNKMFALLPIDTLNIIHTKIWDYFTSKRESFNNLSNSIYSKITPNKKDNLPLINKFRKHASILPIQNIYWQTLGEEFFKDPQNFRDYIVDAETFNYLDLRHFVFSDQVYLTEPKLYTMVKENEQLLKDPIIMSHMMLMGLIGSDEHTELQQKAFQHEYLYRQLLWIINHDRMLISNNKLALVRKNSEKLIDSPFCLPEFQILINKDENKEHSLRSSTIKKNMDSQYDIFFEHIYLLNNAPKANNTSLKARKF